MSNLNRKLDTRNKIELGGLVIKAKLGYLQKDHKEVILGALIDAYNKIQTDIGGKEHFDYFKELGKQSFNQNVSDLNE